jgi:hypothetical protein
MREISSNVVSYKCVIRARAYQHHVVRVIYVKELMEVGRERSTDSIRGASAPHQK